MRGSYVHWSLVFLTWVLHMKFGVLVPGLKTSARVVGVYTEILRVVVSRFASPGLISLDEGFVKWRGNKIYFITVVGRFRGVLSHDVNAISNAADNKMYSLLFIV